MKLRNKLHLLARLWRFRFLRSYSLQSAPKYWRLKRWRGTIEFQFRKHRFKARSLLRDSAETTSIFVQVVHVIFWRLLFSLVLVSALAVLDYNLTDWGPSWLTLVIVDREAQRDFLATLGQVSAAFLALYFTAISVVVSTAYARAPGNIRSLVMREEVGSLYFGVLAQFAGVVTVMLTALSFGYRVGPLNTFLASFLCLFSIFGFVTLGARAFQYFDPAALVSLLRRRIVQAVQSVTPQGNHWLDESFQGYHQRQAAEFLDAFSDLVTIASQRENLHGKGLVDVGQGLLLVLNIYVKEKARIPSSSYWFKRTYKHKNWLLASHNELEMALATGTTVQPDSIPDRMWFEVEAARILNEVYRQLGERRDSSGSVAMASALQNHLGGMGQCLAVAEALHVFKTVVPTLRSQSGGEKITGDKDSLEITNRLAEVELYSLGLINILLGFSNRLETLGPEGLVNLMASIDWPKRRTLYPSEILPRHVIAEIEFLQERLEFELRIEGTTLSPYWLRQELAALGFVRFLGESVKELLGEVENTFGKEADAQLAASNFVLVAQLVQRGLEACDKLSNHFTKFKDLHNAYEAFNRSKEYEWPKIDWEGFQKRITALRGHLVRALALSSNELACIPESQPWPDYFGHAYTVLGEESFGAMGSGNEELFQALFPAFFNLVLRANAKLRQKFISDRRNIRLSVDPLVDLMAISGFAAVFSELDNKSFWKLVEQTWNRYLGLYQDSDGRRQLIELLCAAVEPDWRITPRSVMRTRWQQMFGRILVTRGIFREETFWDGGRSTVNHPSLLVRVFCRSRYLSTEAHDVFLAVYLFKRPESAGVEKPHDVAYLERALRPKANEEGDQG